MKSVPVSRLIASGCVVALVVAAASAQSVAFLTPEIHVGEVGQSVDVRVARADGVVMATTPWPTERLEWLFTRSPGAQSNPENRGPTKAGGDYVTVTLDRPGVTMIGIDAKPAVETIGGQSFKSFVRRATANQTLLATAERVADDAAVRVRRVESAKTLIRVHDPSGGPARHSATAQSKTGQAVEIRALADPTMVPVGSDFPVKIYSRGGKRKAVRVLATCAATGETITAVTGSAGTCDFRITSPGVWRIEFHDVVRLERDPKAGWEIHTATLTFEVSDSGEGK